MMCFDIMAHTEGSGGVAEAEVTPPEREGVAARMNDDGQVDRDFGRAAGRSDDVRAEWRVDECPF